jgi:hypothetical protein
MVRSINGMLLDKSTNYLKDNMADNKVDNSLFEDVPYDEDLFEDVPYNEAEFDDTPQVDKSSSGEAFVGGLGQDVTLGFMDELKGALEAGGQAIGVKGLGKEFGQQELQSPIGLDTEKLLEIYKQGKGTERERIARLEAESPTAFGAGEVTGMVAPLIATGGISAAGNLLKAGGKQLLKKGTQEGLKETAKKEAAKLATSGAITGGGAAGGFSETDVLEQPGQFLEEVGTGATLGAGASLVIPGTAKLGAKALKKIGKGIKEGSKQVTAVLAGLKKGDIDEIIKRADDIKAAVDYPEIQEIITDKTRNVLGAIETLSARATEKLSSKKTITKDSIRKILNDRIEKIATTADDSAVPHVQKILEFIDNPKLFKGELISMQDLHKITQDTGKRAYRGISKDAPGAVRSQLRQSYRELSQILKEAAPKEYKSLAKDMQKRFDLLEKMEKKLGIRVDYDNVILKSEDQLKRKMQEVGRSDALGSERTDIENLIDDLEKLSGKKLEEKSLGDLLKARRLKGELDKGAGEYSYTARTLVGGALGTLFPGVGHVAGGLAGLASRPIARGALKRSSALSKLKVGEKAGKVVDTAAQQGAPLGLAYGVHSGAKVAVNDNKLATKLEDPQYIENLITEFRKSQVPGTQVYADQLEKYSETGDSQEKIGIQFNLSQQPAFRKLLQEHDKLKKDKE